MYTFESMALDVDHRLDLVQEMQKDLWLDRVNAARRDGRMEAWASTLRGLPCRLDGGGMSGSYNLCQKVISSDDIAWILRFNRVGAIHPEYADEKVAVEVEMLTLIRERTTIPVPAVHAWGLAADNPLGLGPYMLMEFVEGVCAKDFLRDTATDSRILREDVDEADIESLFRQFAGFQLQLFALDFDRIGSLPMPRTNFPVPTRPLTWKTHSILQNGGVDTFGDREQGFGSTAEYFKYLAGQDCQQVAGQLNSVSGPFGAESDYAAFNAVKNLAPGMVNKEYDHGPFKLTCDDFGLANLILRSKDDLTVVGVVDLEWSYVGPAQMAASAPWWLIQDRPTNEEWNCKAGDEPPSLAARYFYYLDLYKRVLREEEERRADHGANEFSGLVQWSQDSGAMWLHMLLSGGFNTRDMFPFHQLRRHLGTDKWAELQRHVDKGEMNAFARQKVLHLEQHDADEDEMLDDKKRVESGDLSRLAFIERYRRVLVLGSRKWSEGDPLPNCNAYGEMVLE